MTISKFVPFAAALALLALAGQANAAQHHNTPHSYTKSNASTYDSTYRDPTTREALDEGAW